MRRAQSRFVLTGLLALLAAMTYAVTVNASGPVGVYAVIDKVVFEPNEQAAEKIQVWGAFAFVDGGVQNGRSTADPQRGYLYFTVPPQQSEAQVKTIRKEWADLKAVAGTGQGVAFGDWGYIGAFGEVNKGVYVPQRTGVAARSVMLRVETEPPARATAVPYTTNTGVVKLAATGSQAALVNQLKTLLKK